MAGCRDSHLIVAAGATVRLKVEREGEAMDLVAEVVSGAIQFDLPERGAYRALLIRGGAMQVRVIGTVFMFERVRQDEDYLAMVSGKVKVKLLKALGQGGDSEMEIGGRQGLGAGPNGFGTVDALSQRPQIAAAAAERAGLRAQGLGAAGGWDTDAGLAATIVELSSDAATQAVIANQVTDQIMQQTLNATMQEVINQAIATPAGAHDPIQGPPGPP
jgi:hypothetical protein